MKPRAIISWWVLRYLRFFARWQLNKIKPDIIGVTGSVGKTSAALAMGAILATKYATKVCAGANSESGIPLNILGLKLTNYSAWDWLRVMFLAPVMILVNWRRYEKYVVEMGVDEPKAPKNMGYLLTIVKPRIGVWLNVAAVHTQQFGTVTAIAAEKGKLIEQLPDDGIAVLNRNDPLVWQWSKKTRVKVIPFTEDAAITVGKIFGINKKVDFKPAPGRMSLIEGIKNSLIIDASYNASRESMFRALEVLAGYKHRRKIAVLGDMRELGALAAAEHTAVAQRAKKIADVIVTVGPLMRRYLASRYSFMSAKEAGKLIKDKLLQENDVVLVKGSQNTIFLEIVVEMLMRHPEQADELLCRRGKYWDKIRSTI